MRAGAARWRPVCDSCWVGRRSVPDGSSIEPTSAPSVFAIILRVWPFECLAIAGLCWSGGGWWRRTLNTHVNTAAGLVNAWPPAAATSGAPPCPSAERAPATTNRRERQSHRGEWPAQPNCGSTRQRHESLADWQQQRKERQCLLSLSPAVTPTLTPNRATLKTQTATQTVATNTCSTKEMRCRCIGQGWSSL